MIRAKEDSAQYMSAFVSIYFVSFILLLYNYFTSIPLPEFVCSYIMVHTFLESFLFDSAK
jgi:hypothetical protein